MKNKIKPLLIIPFMVLMCFSPMERQVEIEPYMTVHREMPTGVSVNVELWGTDKLDGGTKNKEDKYLEYSEQGILLIERVCMSEASTEPFEGKVAVAKTIINRAKLYGMSIEEVIYTPYQYSFADNGKPTEEVKKAVQFAINDEDFPDDMIYFKEGEYHDFGIPYRQIGRHYFSLKE